jgi:hypothetical protein
MHFRRLLALAAALALPALTAGAARADISLEGGGVLGSTPSGGAGASIGIFNVPVVPLAVELTGMAPLGGKGGFAATADARLKFGGTSFGAGIGAGDIGNTASTGVIYDAFVAQHVLPLTSIEGRLYGGPQRPSSFFLGLRLTL